MIETVNYVWSRKLESQQYRVFILFFLYATKLTTPYSLIISLSTLGMETSSYLYVKVFRSAPLRSTPPPVLILAPKQSISKVRPRTLSSARPNK
jgi:hypothetical protein